MGKRINRYIILASLADELQAHTNQIPDHIRTKKHLNKRIGQIIKNMEKVSKELNQKDWDEGFGWKDEQRSPNEVEQE